MKEMLLTSYDNEIWRVFESLIAVAVQSIFRSEIYQNNIYFKKNYF